MTPARVDFTTVTEVPGNRVRAEALAELQARYAWAAGLRRGGDVLEVACGAGMGLGMLAATARRAVGADLSADLLSVARQHYGHRIPLVRLRGERLPFRDAAFDLVVMYEALYYFPAPADFVAEAHRVLRPGGALAVCSTNVEWPDFNPSPYSVRYFSAAELRQLLEDGGFSVEMFAGFRDECRSIRDHVVSAVRRIAVAAHLVPRTMAGKAWLKRLFYGSLAEIPVELSVTTQETAFVSMPRGVPTHDYKVIYALAQR